MFDTEERPLPPKLSELITAGWTFPTDYPVVNDATSPDATRTLKEVIGYAVTQHYKDHRICVFNETYFTERLASRLYDVMVQHQYWIDEYLKLIADNQFFYNEEWQDGGTHTIESNDRTTNATSNNLSRVSDTPQNMVGDINNYLTEATKDEGSEVGTENSDRDTAFTTDLHIRKSTLGDITVQFRNFAEFPNFLDKVIKAVSPCFLQIYSFEEVDYGETE